MSDYEFPGCLLYGGEMMNLVVCIVLVKYHWSSGNLVNLTSAHTARPQRSGSGVFGAKSGPYLLSIHHHHQHITVT